MDTRLLGDSDLDITRIGIGAWAMGGPWDYGWGEQDDQDSINTILHAVESGINWIDTAPAYGHGHSEEVVGRALAELPAADRPYVFTKCCFRWDEKGTIIPSLKKESVREEVEESLTRLKVDVIDLYQIHWPNPPEEIEEGWQAMLELQQEGKVRYLGVSNHSVEQMEKLGALGTITSLQPSYSLIHREIEEEVLPYCEQNNIGAIAYSPMGSGLLTGRMTRERIENFGDTDWRRHSDDFKEPLLSRNLLVAEKVDEVAAKHGVPSTEVAIAWVLKNSAITGAIAGMRSPAQCDGLINAANVELDQEDTALLESV